MNRSAARDLLLRQHEQLRLRLGRCTALAMRLLGGTPIAAELDRELDALRAEFAEHNRSEERLLEPLLSGRDAWAPARIARMIEEHAAEHAAIRGELEGTAAEVAKRLADLVEELDAHMAAEERTFLSPQVLGDE